MVALIACPAVASSLLYVPALPVMAVAALVAVQRRQPLLRLLALRLRRWQQLTQLSCLCRVPPEEPNRIPISLVCTVLVKGQYVLRSSTTAPASSADYFVVLCHKLALMVKDKYQFVDLSHGLVLPSHQ